ncbi:MAG: hypothetical protein QM706_08080 [Nitrospira sp.]
MIGEGSHIVEADIRRSVIGRNVHIEAGARLDECVIMDGVRIGAQARLHRVIADRFSSIPANSEIGPYENPGGQVCHVSSGGLVVLPRNTTLSTDVMQQAL